MLTAPEMTALNVQTLRADGIVALASTFKHTVWEGRNPASFYSAKKVFVSGRGWAARYDFTSLPPRLTCTIGQVTVKFRREIYFLISSSSWAFSYPNIITI